MFVRAILVILQAIAFLAVFFVGSILPVFHVLPTWKVAVGANHFLVLDGLLLMLLLYVIIVGIEAAMKRMTAAGLTTLAMVLALVLGLAMKFGFTTPTSGM